MNSKKKSINLRKQETGSIRENELTHHQLLQNLPAAAYACDIKGRITFYNEAAAKLWGREPELGVDLWCGSWKIYKTDGSPFPLETHPIGIALKEGRAFQSEEIVVERPNGERLNVIPHPRPIYDDKGNIVAAMNMLIDVTDLKRQSHSDKQVRFKPAGDFAPVFIWMCDEKKHFTFFNKGWLDFTGHSLEKEYGNGWMKGIHPEDIRNYMNLITTAFEARKIFSAEFRLKSRLGEYRWLSSRGEPKYSSQGSFEGYIGSCTDIHEHKTQSAFIENRIAERTKLLNQTIGQLERSNHELAQFAYVVTHDLQEPLRKVKTFTDRLMIKASRKLAEDEKIYLGKIKNSADRMSGLIKDVLNYSVLTRSAEAFIKTDLNHIAKFVVTDFELLITQKKARISIGKLPVIEAVHLQMNQLFNNLIGNSLKFTSAEVVPHISLTSSNLSDEETVTYGLVKGRQYVNITFSDNGIGFGQEYAEKIFEIFQRLNGNDEYPGTGIGLALCKKIILNHKGIIRAESKPGEGASFHVILPLKQI